MARGNLKARLKPANGSEDEDRKWIAEEERPTMAVISKTQRPHGGPLCFLALSTRGGWGQIDMVLADVKARRSVGATERFSVRSEFDQKGRRALLAGRGRTPNVMNNAKLPNHL